MLKTVFLAAGLSLAAVAANAGSLADSIGTPTVTTAVQDVQQGNLGGGLLPAAVIAALLLALSQKNTPAT